MAGPERDDVDMDIDEVLGLIAPKGCAPEATSQPPAQPAPTSPKTASQPLSVQTVAVLGSLASSKAETEASEAPAAAKKVPLPSEAALGGALGDGEEDDMYDPLAGDDLPQVGLANPERGDPAEHFKEGEASASPNGESTAVKSFGFSAASARQGAACPALEVAEISALESTGAMRQAQGEAENLGTKTKRRSDAAAPETATALAGLLEQYSDEESDPEEPGQVIGKSKQVSGEPRQVSGEEGRSPAAQKADARGTAQNARVTEKGHPFSKSAGKERAIGVREDFLEERDGRARTSADKRNAENERNGGNERDLKGSPWRGNEGLGASGPSTERESTSGFDQGYRDQRKRDEGRRERERPGDSHETRDRRKDRNWKGDDPDRHRGEGRAGGERRGERNHEGGRDRNRDMGDRRDDASFQGVHRNPRERGGHYESAGGRRADHRGNDREYRNRHDNFRERNRPRAPPKEGPDSKAARGADSSKKPDSKLGAMAGSTGADVDLSAAVAQAAAAAARSAKLAASRAPPPAPADPAEAAAKAAEMGALFMSFACIVSFFFRGKCPVGMSASLLHFCACEGGIQVVTVAKVLHGGIEGGSTGTAEARARERCNSGDPKTGWQYHAGVSVLAHACFSAV
jgi:hypothetical protein